jgi:hypothetical protein
MAEPISAACGAWDDLWGAGFPDPVLGDSGNGTHLLYPVDLPNDSDIICLGEAPEETASTARPAGDRGYDGEGQIGFGRAWGGLVLYQMQLPHSCEVLAVARK